jgi:hypothetical protein
MRKGYNPPPMRARRPVARVFAAASTLAVAAIGASAAPSSAIASPAVVGSAPSSLVSVAAPSPPMPQTAGAAPAPAVSRSPPPDWAPREWALSAGVFDLNKSDRAEGGLEARFAPLGFRLFGRDWAFEPALGAFGTDDGAFYGYFSLRLPLDLGARWRATPFTGAGVYSAGDGKDLGGPVEFRSGLELTVELGARARAGVAYAHISNGVLYDRNPGAESLVLTVAFRP